MTVGALVCAPMVEAIDDSLRACLTVVGYLDVGAADHRNGLVSLVREESRRTEYIAGYGRKQGSHL
jgi:hypothetical protein